MKQTLPQSVPTLLILSSAEIDENIAKNDLFVDRLNERLGGNCRIEWQNYHNIGLEMDHQSLKAFVVTDGRPLSDFNAVYFKSYFRYHEQATAIAEALAEQNVPFV